MSMNPCGAVFDPTGEALTDRDPCVRLAGHVGEHTDRSGITWTDIDEGDGPEPGHFGTPARQDPNEGETEAKLDKVRMELIDLNFVADMAQQLQKGIRANRVPWGWTQYDPKEFVPLLRGSILRHLRATETGLLAKDSDTGASHWAAIAVNAMMCWGLERIEAGIDKVRG